MATLSERVIKPDLVGLPDWQVAEILNEPDQTLPVIVTLKSTSSGPGGVMQAIGPDAGAQFLDNLETLATSVPKIRWAMQIIRSNGLDMSDPDVRSQIDSFAASGLLSASNAQKLKALGEVRRHPSWAEFHEIVVTARTVGLARGAQE
jgi:hypothetical protein